MSERTVEVNMTFTTKDTNSFPPVSGMCVISAKALNGAIVKSSHKHEANSDKEILKTMARQDSFRAKIVDVIMQIFALEAEKPVAKSTPVKKASPEPAPAEKEPEPEEKATISDYDKQREAHYASISKDLSGKKIGQIREFVTKHGIPVATGGKKKELVIQEIIEYIRQKEAQPEE